MNNYIVDIIRPKKIRITNYHNYWPSRRLKVDDVAEYFDLINSNGVFSKACADEKNGTIRQRIVVDHWRFSTPFIRYLRYRYYFQIRRPSNNELDNFPKKRARIFLLRIILERGYLFTPNETKCPFLYLFRYNSWPCLFFSCFGSLLKRQRTKNVDKFDFNFNRVRSGILVLLHTVRENAEIRTVIGRLFGLARKAITRKSGPYRYRV